MPERSSPLSHRISSILFIAMLAELALGGGGRLTAYGPVSLRMIFFVMALGVTAYRISRGEKIPREYVVLTILFSLVLFVAWLRGVSVGADRIFWWQDVKPLLSFYILPFFFLCINTSTSVNFVADLLKFSGLLLSALFLFVLLLIHLDVIPFLVFYHLVIGTEEFFFRGEFSFFYKGFLYLCVAFIFLRITNEQIWKLVLVALAIVLTFTRGFWFSLLLTGAVYYTLLLIIQKNGKIFRPLIFLLLAGVVAMFGNQGISGASRLIDLSSHSPNESSNEELDPTLLGDREYSDSKRTTQIKEVFKDVSVSSSIVGHGFGIGIPSRPVHMEISYLEIFHKQGVIGLLFWAFLFYMIFLKFWKVRDQPLAQAFFLSTVFVFIQSLTNQYFNNPIGLSMVLLSLVCLDRLSPAGGVN